MFWDESRADSEVDLLNREGFDPQALLHLVHGDFNLLQELVDLFGT